MYKYAAVFVLTCVFFSLGKNCSISCPDYYWRDYTGTIPSDAYAGAVDGNVTLYVGQVFFRQWNLLPATIYSNTGLAYTTAYGNMLITNEYVKILASPDNSIFEWTPIQSKDLHLYLNRAVPGGSEVGQPIYIGKVRHGGKTIIGKVFKDDQSNKGLWVQHSGQTHSNYLQYDLLTFNCNQKLVHVLKEVVVEPQ